MSIHLAAYLTFTLAFAVTPGTTTAVVIQQALAGGWRAGVSTATGAALANTVHATAAALGLALLVQRWPDSIRFVRYAGGSYLLYLGGRSLWRAAHLSGWSTEGHQALSIQTSFRHGLVTNLLNPSIVTFYAVAVPTFLPPGMPLAGFALLGAIHVSIAFCCHCGWTAVAESVSGLLQTVPARRWLAAVTGIALIALAVRVL